MDTHITVLRGDITQLAVDALVNAANTSLLGGGGVDGAIHRAAGPRLAAACRALPEVAPGVRCPTGEARLTPGFSLPAHFVIHTVGPVWRGGSDDEDAALASCYRASLDLADAHGLASVAFPAVSCGIYGYPRDRATALAVRTIRQRLATATSLAAITLVGYDDLMAAQWRHALTLDPADGWDTIARDVAADRERTRIGEDVLRRWAAHLDPGADVLDLGCGGGEPVSRVLVEAGAHVTGVDASPRMIAAYRLRFPDAAVECAPAETAATLGRSFDAIVAVGLLFLLDPTAQRTVLRRAAVALRPGGRLLFTAPSQAATWADLSTGRESRSLGRAAYAEVLEASGLRLTDTFVDAGESHYYSAVKPTAR